ncbi:RTT106 protein [Sordaria macrospora]|uniref:WGS project CABT00000000 data, contig 2.9 n=2 Tax=Sordaria macrospora TaxID=5147 RepID=F7VVL7_SORMK|nr:uncharacterized protein SMAC_03589 [Sordaria macrospora k-hell]KAA8636123.1 RTT106 protein [Sordaria macrospora]KAH7625817.1 hypothetical protein B0T09DRAFT_377523 [Sordaria sp. MPI-SDFR-AT-0083]WPJ65985.1 hypothetical protein SMAC4_03589 [Sordaria macrospora]CCC09558.1 unnamed protein product [Sordaria macrospora k-hell]
MAAKLDSQTLGLVFQSRPDILKGIKEAADSPARIDLFNNIASFVYERIANNTSEEPATKRRRVEAQTSGSNGATHPIAGSQAAVLGADAAAAEPVLLEIKDISISVPQRKKYDLCFTKNFLYARASGSPVPVQGIVYPWKDLEHAFYLPVPEKSQVQHSYVLLPRSSYLSTTKSQPPADQQTQQATTPLEPLVFTIPSTAPKPGTIAGPSAAAAAPVSDSYATLFHWALTTSLRAAGNHACELVSSDPKVFHSVARQAYRPQEKAVHVKAFRGSKDGFLFFLPTGILWGFKKPLLFLPLEKIVAVSYTSVLQRTFNIVVELEATGKEDEGGGQEIEFSMLDQEDYAMIDQSYVRRHGLADRSMAEQRKAKKQLAENAKRAAAGEDGVEGGGADGEGADDGLTELERAQKEEEQRLQDEEDEEEEDYDPGSDGESEGSGSSDDEEEEDGEGEGDEDDDEDMGEGLEE